jgi:hypothetical protein
VELITERTVFATYVRDSLITMQKQKFRKARSTINKMLSQLMEEDSDDDIPSSMGGRAMHQPLRPIPATPSYYVASPSEMYQPPPHMWRHNAPPASVWGSQTQDYMEKYMQQPRDPMMPHPLPVLGQQQLQQRTPTSVSSEATFQTCHD